MSKKTYITTARIEERDKDGKKSVIPANKELQLTAAQAKKYGKAVRELKVEAPEEIESDDDTGEGSEGTGGEGGNA